MTGMITVTIWHNLTCDDAGRRTGPRGFTPGDQMVKVFTYQAEPRGRSARDCQLNCVTPETEEIPVTDVTTGQGQGPAELSAADEQVLREPGVLAAGSAGRTPVGSVTGRQCYRIRTETCTTCCCCRFSSFSPPVTMPTLPDPGCLIDLAAGLSHCFGIFLSVRHTSAGA